LESVAELRTPNIADVLESIKQKVEELNSKIDHITEYLTSSKDSKPPETAYQSTIGKTDEEVLTNILQDLRKRKSDLMKFTSNASVGLERHGNDVIIANPKAVVELGKQLQKATNDTLELKAADLIKNRISCGRRMIRLLTALTWTY